MSPLSRRQCVCVMVLPVQRKDPVCDHTTTHDYPFPAASPFSVGRPTGRRTGGGGVSALVVSHTLARKSRKVAPLPSAARPPALQTCIPITSTRGAWAVLLLQWEIFARARRVE